MTEYLLLLKLDKEKLLGTIDTLRHLPKNPSSGVDLEHMMNIFGTWDVAMWFDADNSDKAVDFINNKIGKISGVVDAFPVATFPHVESTKEAAKEDQEEAEAIKEAESDSYEGEPDSEEAEAEAMKESELTPLVSSLDEKNGEIKKRKAA